MTRSLRARRVTVGLTQRALAELAGVGCSTVSALERGETVSTTSAGKVVAALLRAEARARVPARR